MQEEKKTHFLNEYHRTPYNIPSLYLCFRLDPEHTTVTSEFEVQARDPQKLKPLYLAGQNIELLGIAIDGRSLSNSEYQLDTNGLIISNLQASFRLTIETRVNPKANKALEGLYISNDIFCTQCEPEGFRRITYFYDRPDIMAKYKVRIEAKKDAFPTLLSNGNCVESGDLADGYHFTTWEDPFPKPSYLFALVAGKLANLRDFFITKSKKKVQLDFYALPKDIHKCEFAIQALKKAMRWDEDRFGLECDLQEYKVVAIGDFNMGAMENKGLNIFNTALVLAEPQSTTDASYARIENVIGHEYFHNWTGNRVTCRDWFQLCLKEGLTVFRDQEFSQDIGSRAVVRVQEVSLLRQKQWLEDDGPMAHPPRPSQYIEINNFYTNTVYIKGAEVVRMLHTLLGEENFRAGMELYFKRHDGQAVTQEEFVLAMADASGLDLTQFMAWYTQAGTPVISVETKYDAEHSTFTIDFVQHVPKGQKPQGRIPYALPLKMALLDPNGNEIPLICKGEKVSNVNTRVFCLRSFHETLTFVNVTSPVVPSLFRNFSAAAKIDFTQSNSDLRFLIKHDSDLFNRWDSAQKLYLVALLAMYEKIDTANYKVDLDLLDCFAAILDNADMEPYFKALMLCLPDEAMLAQSLEKIDVKKLSFLVEDLPGQIGGCFVAKFTGIYEKYHKVNRDLTSQGIANRSLKNQALFYLQAQLPEIPHPLVMKQYEESILMTDKLAALRLACRYWPEVEKKELLRKHYASFLKDDLCVDSWFAVQATIPGKSSLSRVQDLLKHPAFNLENPNRVRSLLSQWSHNNISGFHQGKDVSYAIIGDYVKRLNIINPMMAANLCRSLEQWKRFTEPNASAMREQLEIILRQEQISPDVFEICSKSLGV